MKNMFLANGRCPSCRGDVQQQVGGAVCGNVKCQLNGKLLSPVNDDGEYGGHELGGTYWCGYWCEAYTVTDMDPYDPVWGWVVKSEWHGRDKRTTVHSTSLDAKRDCLITELPRGEVVSMGKGVYEVDADDLANGKFTVIRTVNADITKGGAV